MAFADIKMMCTVVALYSNAMCLSVQMCMSARSVFISFSAATLGWLHVCFPLVFCFAFQHYEANDLLASACWEGIDYLLRISKKTLDIL